MSSKIVKSNIMLKISFILFALVLITSHFTSGLYARYTNKSTVGDFARVAAFHIETDLDHVTLGVPVGAAPSFELGGEDEVANISIPFYVESSSEVTVEYSVEVDFGSGVELPSSLSLTLSNVDNSKTETLSAQGNTIFSFDEFNTMAPGNTTPQSEELDLTISIADLSEIVDEITIPTVGLTVKVYQVD